MTLEEIQERVDALREAMTNKGLKTCQVELNIPSDKDPYLYLKSADKIGVDGENYHFVHGANAWKVFNDAEAFIDAIPDTTERDDREFLKKVSDAAEFGRSIGKDHETYIAPLRSVAQAVSENLLTHDE